MRPLTLLFLAALPAAAGCGLLWDFGTRAGFRRDLAKLLTLQSIPGQVRACEMAGPRRTGTCFWAAAQKDADMLVESLSLTEKAPREEDPKWKPRGRCARFGRDPRTKAFGIWGKPHQLRFGEGKVFESLILFTSPDAEEACIQADYPNG